MTRDVRRIGIKNAAIVLCGTLLLIALLTGGIVTLFAQPIRVAFNIASIILLTLCAITFISAYLRTHTKAGDVLLDCGPPENSGLIKIIAVGFVFITTFSLVDVIGELWQGKLEVGDLKNLVLNLFCFTLFSLWSLSRLQVRQRGILCYLSLIPWGKIKTYEWKEANGQQYSLVFERRGRFPVLSRGAIAVPSQDQSAFEELLREHVKHDRG